MKPEEVNKALAEKVMGWHIVSFFGREYWKGAPDGIWVEDWDPYHRIDHAWMVIERLASQGVYIHLFDQLGYDETFDNYHRFRCAFWVETTEIFYPVVEADTAPATICLAALKAVKEDDSEKK